MNQTRPSLPTFIERALPIVILLILLLYTYAKFFEHPYLGFRWDPGGELVHVFTTGNQQNPLKVGDQLIQVGAMPLTSFEADYLKTFNNIVRPGKTVAIVVKRDGQRLTIPWKFPGLNSVEFDDQASSEVWLTFFFWIVGTLALLSLRPKDERWRLMIAFNYLTAFWIGVGGGASFYHIWYSPFLLRIAVWFCIPVYLHFHWVFPQPFRKLPPAVTRGGYFVAGLLALAECFQLLPQSLYLLGFLLAVGGSLILLVAHAIRQPQARRDIGLLLIAALLSLIPSIVVGLLATFSTLPNFSGAGTLGLIFLPLAYFYAAYRRQIGNLELRVNRFISILVFLVFLFAITLPLVVVADQWITLPGATIAIGVIATMAAGLFTLLVFSSFQSFVERRILRIPLPPTQLLEVYSGRITTSPTLSDLETLLKNEVLPSLLVRQFVFLQIDGSATNMLVADGITQAELPSGNQITDILPDKEQYRTPELKSERTPLPWVRIVLPLKIGDDLIGLWLLGRRDPDDIYTQPEIAVIQSLANQTAIALSNIVQTERLLEMYQADINRYEEERLRLALDLHDSILNQMAAMLMHLDTSSTSPEFQESYDRLTQRLREIVTDLRPPMLNYGLKPALDELADSLMEHRGGELDVVIDIQAGESRYPANVEQHLFRIVQEACENALRHGKAQKITISGTLGQQEGALQIEDDGTGFDLAQGVELNALLANKHFGLAGMIERARLVDGKIEINSEPDAGTTIRLIWKFENSEVDK